MTINSSDRYSFRQIETALTAFVGNIRIKVNSYVELTNRYGDIPVMFVENGDETYLNINKEKTDQKEQYLKVPRCVINFDDISLETDQDTQRLVEVNYLLSKGNSNELWTGSFRRKAITLPVILNFVCSSYIQAMEFEEMILSFLTIENVSTYNWLGNDYPFDYQMNTVTIERNSMDMGGTKNVVVKAMIDLKLQLMIPRMNTLTKIGETLSHTGNEGNIRNNDGNNQNGKNNGNGNNGNNNGNNGNNGNNKDKDGNIDSGRDKNQRFKPKFNIHSKLPDDPKDEFTYITELDPDKTLNN